MAKRVLAGAFFIACLCFLTAWSSAPAGPVLQARPDFGKMPLNFIPNRGQWDQRVAYGLQGKDKTIWFDAAGVTFALTGRQAQGDGQWVVKLDFVGAKPDLKPVALDETGTVISYFHGRPAEWKTGLPASSRIIYKNLWPGIDLVYSGTMDRLKYEFIVHPGADPSRIRLAYRGASSVLINDKGSLVVSTPLGGFEDGIPLAYQEEGGKRAEVRLGYQILKSGQAQANKGGPGREGREAVVYGFSVGPYDRSQPLLLDPEILIYCGYIGGPSFDYSYGIAADPSGHAYLTGFSYSLGTAFPVTVGPDRTFNGGSVDAFVGKLNPSGTAWDYCGYIGGSGDDYAYGIAVDSSGNAYVTGYTNSTEATFPVRVGPDLTHNGLFDVFVAKVNADGTALDYCGYIGGLSNDFGRGMAVDSFGRATVTGSTYSSEATFPVTVGPDLTWNGSQDAFVAAVDPAGTALVYCGYIGGSADDYGSGVAVDSSGNAYVIGSTNSTESTFPIVAGPDDTQNGDYDAFLANVSADGSGFIYCGYIGGSGKDYGCGVAVDLLGYAYVTGSTNSTESTFPIMTGPDLTSNGGFDAFVARVYTEGTWLLYCGYLGGSGYDCGTGIAVDGWGFAVVTGYTSSKEDTFPITEGPDLTHHGSFDAFLVKLVPSGTVLSYCGYLGGADADLGMGVALDANGSGNVYLTGYTYSTEATFPVTVGPDLSHNGSRDGFVAKVHEDSIIVIDPNGGEVWHVGFVQNITWLTIGRVGPLRIEYSTDNGETWAEIVASTENDGAYAWLVPDAVSTECLVRISDAESGSPSDMSNAVFSITDEPFVDLIAPNGGENWTVGSAQDITWLSGGGMGDVKIEYSADDGATWTEVIDSTANNGSYTWIVPDAVSDLCLVRISEAVNGTPSDVSDRVFSIIAPGLRSGPTGIPWSIRSTLKGGPN